MDKKLFTAALTKYALGVVLVALILFVPAGTLRWWQGWLFMAILFVPMFVAGLVMMAKAPDLLRKRLDAKEDEQEQRTVVALSALMFLAAFVVAGLTVRFGWPLFPAWVSWVGAVLFLAAYALYNATLLIFSTLNKESLCRAFTSAQQFRIRLMLELRRA